MYTCYVKGILSRQYSCWSMKTVLQTMIYSLTISIKAQECKTFSTFLGGFESGGVFSGQRTLTIECSVMSGWGHELAKNF